MAKFTLGFGVASVLWATVAAGLVWGLGWGPPVEPAPSEVEDPSPAAESAEVVPVATKRPRRRRGSSANDEAHARSEGRDRIATSGDDLDETRPRVLDMTGSGGEAQLTPSQIEAAMDTAMPRIRRCLILAASEEPVRGRLVFGLRIRGDGEVVAVNLTGPAAVSTGECGDCLRSAVRATRFPRFDGPEMVARYPITLE